MTQRFRLRMTDAELQAIRERATAAIPGPWRWYGNTAGDQVYLATPDRGRLFILSPHVEVVEGYAETQEPWRFLSGDEYDRLPVAEREWFVPDKRHTLHLRFPALRREDDPRERNEHGGAVMQSHRKLARYEVLDGQTREAAGLDPDADFTNSTLYREDIVGLDNPEAEFIANARTDIDALLEEVDRLRSELGHHVEA